jgi:hypothetical protein
MTLGYRPMVASDRRVPGPHHRRDNRIVVDDSAKLTRPHVVWWK